MSMLIELSLVIAYNMIGAWVASSGYLRWVWVGFPEEYLTLWFWPIAVIEESVKRLRRDESY